MPTKPRLLTATILALLCLCRPAAAAPDITRTVHVASRQLGVSGVLVSVEEDYRRTQWPVARRALILRGPSGRTIRAPLHDGGAGGASELRLYARKGADLDARGHAIGGDFLLIGASDCVGFDPVFMDVTRCAARPKCREPKDNAGLTYLGRFDWGNGYDPPRGDFRFGWRFMPFEDTDQEAYCLAAAAPPPAVR
jgi:hypothetical protein